LLLAKASPALAQKEPLAEIEAMIVTCLREAFEEPRIVVRVPQPLFDPIRGRLASLAHDGSFAGKFVLLVDDALGPADCRLEWADGGAERDTSRLARELDAALERALTTPTPEPSSQEPSHE
jgi:flagellar assembly protein FliH